MGGKIACLLLHVGVLLEEVVVLFLDLLDLKLKLFLLGFRLRYLILDRSYRTLLLHIFFMDLFSCLARLRDVLLIVFVFFLGNFELLPLVTLLRRHIFDFLV